MCVCVCVCALFVYECVQYGGGGGGGGDLKIDFVKNLIAFHTPLTRTLFDMKLRCQHL